MARTSTYSLHDRLLDGRLGAMLLEARAAGKTVEDIAFELRRDHDLKVSVSTLHRWLSIAESEASLVPSEEATR